MRQNINESAESNKDLDQLFSLLERFSKNFPKYFGKVSLQDVQNDIRRLMEDWFTVLSDDRLDNLYALFSEELYKFKIKDSFNHPNPLVVSNLFYEIREKVARIPKILEQRFFIQWVKDAVTHATFWTLLGKDTFKDTLVEHNFHLKRELVSEERTLFFIQTPMDTYYFINPNPQKGEKTVFAYGGENFKGYKFGENKIYQFTQKIPWKSKDIQNSANEFLKLHYDTSLEDFLASFMSPEVLKKVGQVLFLDYPLYAIIEKLPVLIRKWNILGLQEGKKILFVENADHQLSNQGERKKISHPKKAEKGFYRQEAIFFNVEKLDGEKGILVTNGNQTECIPL